MKTAMRTALVVDNHPVFVAFLESLLTREGYRVRTAEDGLSAWQLLQKETPTVVFTDLIMPNIGGDRLCHLIRRVPQFRSIYLALITGVAPEMENLDRPPFGADALIAKCPFDHMAAYVHQVLEQIQLPSEQRAADLMLGLDVARPRQISRELMAGKRHSELILDCISEGICELTLDGTIVYVNAAARRIFDLPLETLIAAHFVDFFKNSERDAVAGFLGQACHTGSSVVPKFSFQLGALELELDIVPQPDSLDPRIIVILHDVTQKNRDEVKLREARKIKAVGTLASGIAHDFNNILMAIQGNTSLLLLEISQGDPRYPRLKSIEAHIENASRVTRQLLGYARMGRYEIRRREVNQLLEETAETFGRARKDIAIRRRFTEMNTCAEVDSGQFKQALLNLLVTAGNTMPNGGTISLKTQRISQTVLPARFPNPRPGDYIRIEMADTGVGMEPAVRESLFEPFFAPSPSQADNPLGLAAAYGSIKGHGGFVRVESTPGAGTCFYLYIPAVPLTELDETSCTIEEDAPSAETAAQAGEGAAILLIDDNQTILDIGQGMLEALGYQVITAGDGASAVNRFKNQYSDFDLVLMDLALPDMEGETLFQTLQAIKPDIKVLIISGRDLDQRAEDLLSAGCCGFIPKPFTMETMAEQIQSVRQDA